jgi:endonuclease-3
LPALIVRQYTPIMAKITRKPVPRKAAAPKKAKAAVAKPKPAERSAPAKKSLKAIRPWTPAEVR